MLIHTKPQVDKRVVSSITTKEELCDKSTQQQTQTEPLTRGVWVYCPFWRNPRSFRRRSATIAVEEGVDGVPMFIFAKGSSIVKQGSDGHCQTKVWECRVLRLCVGANYISSFCIFCGSSDIYADAVTMYVHSSVAVRFQVSVSSKKSITSREERHHYSTYGS